MYEGKEKKPETTVLTHHSDRPESSYLELRSEGDCVVVSFL